MSGWNKPDRGTVTLNDVARLAGVSPATVSRVVNGDGKVREDTQDKVRAAIRELGYTPNQAARSLASARRVRIGVIYNNPSATYLSALLLGAMDQCASHGAELLMITCQFGDEASERAVVERVAAGQVDGVILPSPSDGVSVVTDLLRARGVHIIAVGGGGSEFNVSCVCVNDRAAAREMTNHLLDLGHRRIGFIKGHPRHQSSHERQIGFEQAMAACPGAQPVLTQGFFTFESGLAAAEALLDHEEPLSAIFACNDDMAAAVVSVAHRRGLEIPRDLSVVGFDDVATAVNLWPPLTTVRQPVISMAATAVDLLLRDVRGGGPPGGPDDITRQLLPYELVRRQSTAPPPARVRLAKGGAG